MAPVQIQEPKLKIMEAWQEKKSEYETEKHLQLQCTEYLQLLKNQGHVWFWHDKSNDQSIVEIVLKIASNYFQNTERYNDFACKIRKIEKQMRNDKGFPDLIVWIRRIDDIYGRWVTDVLSFELKTPTGKGKLTKGQKEFLEFLADSRHEHYILNWFLEFKSIIDSVIR